MSAVITIPVLPCISLPETVAFYGILGFEVTHQQTTPNVYAAMRRGEVNLHFMGIKGLDPAKAYSTRSSSSDETRRTTTTKPPPIRSTSSPPR